ncbi:hypothetical protein [Bradyrhizobium sp. AZCC 2289]|uniref:hypothetical protein n=1 Tax=Bradyrhizobium sp. AZCC 2289 TaxID=3117026 RepID=UPI002FEF2EBE
MTFDIEKSHFVFERAGGNIITGEIISTTDEQLDLSLRGAGGRILLSYNRKRNVVTWPGLLAGELGRFAMHHTCTGVTGRTMLSTFYQPEPFDPKRRDPIDAFSLSCPGNTGPFFITMDRVTKTVVVENEHSSGGSSGNITRHKGWRHQVHFWTWSHESNRSGVGRGYSIADLDIRYGRSGEAEQGF